ncbi:MAG: hypothetical protein ACJAQW_002075 [Paracoccaceae bacterium]
MGQVQSNINHRITVNFEHVGKMSLDGQKVPLELVFE